MKTDRNNERRIETRMPCHWPIWFAVNFNRKLMQGQMIDISSKAASFTSYAYESHLFPGQKIVAHFSVPIYGLSDSFAMRDFTRSGCILSIDNINGILCRIATEFGEILSFKPGEQTKIEPDVVSLLKALSKV